MGRPNKPWYRAQSDSWVVKVGGRQHTLAKGKKNRAAAMRAFHELMARLGRTKAPPDDLPAWSLCDHFLDRARATLSAHGYTFYRQRLRQFLAAVGRNRPAASVREHEVLDWLRGDHEWARKDGTTVRRPWSRTTQANAVRAIKACYRWGLREGHIPSNPLANLSAPAAERADAYATREELACLLGASRGHLRPALEFMMETGCRPSEAARLEAAHVDMPAGVASLPGKTTRRTGKPRVIYLTDRAVAILRAAWREDGPIFRTASGTPWRNTTLWGAIKRVRDRAGLGSNVTTKSFRHVLATEAIAGGMPGRIVAELLGHTSTAMIDKHYLHLAKKHEEMRAAAEKAARRGEDSR